MTVTPAAVTAYLQGSSSDPNAEACLKGLNETPNAWRLGGGIDGIRNAAKHYRMSEGQFIVKVLRAFYGNMERGVPHALAHVCALHWQMNGIRPPMTVDELGQSFRSRVASEWNDVAMSLISDAQVALGGWIQTWNRKQTKLEAQYLKRIQKLH